MKFGESRFGKVWIGGLSHVTPFPSSEIQRDSRVACSMCMQKHADNRFIIKKMIKLRVTIRRVNRRRIKETQGGEEINFGG